MTWSLNQKQCYEAAKIRWELVPYTRGRGLDVGCGLEKAFPHFIGVDNNQDEWLFGEGNRAVAADLIVPDATVLDGLASGVYDFVFSSHMLEHVEKYQDALKEWWRLIKPGGFLILYLPHADLYPRRGTEGANPDHKWDFREADIIQAMKDLGGWDRHGK